MTDDQRGPRPPVVGMVGAGQLARMTCQAAIGLGIGFRVLAGTPADSAALVCADTVTGDYTALPDLLAFARGCDVLTFDHEHVPGEHLAALERAAADKAGAGQAARRYGRAARRSATPRTSWPCASGCAPSACPARGTRR